MAAPLEGCLPKKSTMSSKLGSEQVIGSPRDPLREG
jgi:hypothetical protein